MCSYQKNDMTNWSRGIVISSDKTIYISNTTMSISNKFGKMVIYL